MYNMLVKLSSAHVSESQLITYSESAAASGTDHTISACRKTVRGTRELTPCG